MGKFDELLETYLADMKKKGIGGVKIDQKVLHGAAKACGPSLYKKDAATVACSDKEEMGRIKKNFLVKKLGLDAENPKLDEALKETCKDMGSSNRNKQRAVFYYLLIKRFKKSSMFKE